MAAEKTNEKEDKAKTEGSGPMGSGMFEMMKKCCTGEGAFSDCSTKMKSMMETMRSHSCCSPGAGDTESERGKR